MTTPDINRLLKDRPVGSRFGAPMGRRSVADSGEPLYLQRVNFVDGDYAPDGTYWGYTRGSHLWCAFTPDLLVEIYVRAADRKAAAVGVLDQFNGVSFHKGVATVGQTIIKGK